MKRILVPTFIVLALLASACASATPTAAPVVPVTGPTATTAPVMPTDTVAAAMPTDTVAAAMPSGPAVVNVGQNTALGSILVDSNGMTLYIFTKDTPNTSTCYGGCAKAWPPLLTTGAPTGGTGVTASMLGTTTRTDGTTQVTYNGWPLYYFDSDAAAGDTKGEGVATSWYVMTPAGTQK
jgi:predicted lipoprotein with Yx(FWY)xxD motif